MTKQSRFNEPRIVRRGGVVTTPSLRIEGPVVARWLPILELQTRWLLRGAETTYLDFAGITEIDGAGAAMLKALASSYCVQILGCPPPALNVILEATSPTPN